MVKHMTAKDISINQYIKQKQHENSIFKRLQRF